MTYRFKTPSIWEGPAGTTRLLMRYKLLRGISVLKKDGEYRELRGASREEVETSDKFYLGGITYTVDAAEKADLEAAGYVVTTE